VQRDNLSQVKSERVAQKKSLEDEKGARQQVLYKLSEQIRKQRKEIDTLVRDEKRLTRLIERLARLAAAPKPQATAKPGQKVNRVADASLASLDFDRLKASSPCRWRAKSCIASGRTAMAAGQPGKACSSVPGKARRCAR